MAAYTYCKGCFGRGDSRRAVGGDHFCPDSSIACRQCAISQADDNLQDAANEAAMRIAKAAEEANRLKALELELRAIEIKTNACRID